MKNTGRFFAMVIIGMTGLFSVAQTNYEPNYSPVIKNNQSPFSVFKSTSLKNVTWTEGFWKDRVDLVRNITIPYLYEVMNIEDQGKSVHNLKIAAGLKKGEYKGNNWQDEWIYKWIEMAVADYAATGNKELETKMDELITLIDKAQEKDGYISTNVQVKGIGRFERPQNHEWYNMGHLLTAAALHHRITGKDNFLNVANKVCDFGYQMFKDHNIEMAHFPYNPSIIMGAVEMYRETGNPKHLELAKMIVDMRGKYPGGTDDYQDRIPLRDETEVIGHAVFYSYLYAGAADVYMETGDSTLIKVLNVLWHDLVEKKMFIHGGTGALYRGFGIRTDGTIFWKANEVHEAAGFPYQQPNAYSYNETCGQIGNFMWNYRMLLITGEARFAEVMENEMYNGFMGSMGQDAKGFFYVNPLRWHGHEQIVLKNSSHERGIPGSDNVGTCCPTNYSRSLVELQGMFYSKSYNAFWIHHYGANKYNDGEIILEQKTKFPWEGKVEIDIAEIPKDQSLKIRIPDWAEGTKVTVNGRTIQNIKTSSYLTLSGLNPKNDHIIIEFPMEAKLLAGNPKIEETLNQVAVKRGPVLYTLEEIDLPEGIGIDQVVIPADIKLTPLYKPGLLNGITVLEGTAKFTEKRNWNNVMYKEFRKTELNFFKVSLIPYYTWANRGVSKMSVWLPVVY